MTKPSICDFLATFSPPSSAWLLTYSLQGGLRLNVVVLGEVGSGACHADTTFDMKNHWKEYSLSNGVLATFYKEIKLYLCKKLFLYTLYV